ncbi:CPBP family intramembrane glutamic endopeptidase [Halobaculum sp. MBLA0147]|uniref:CPBP family intramembrane glutamic endopeptidase n=1 Tax=Halobaculum sp. MBLA0147 TaxID=3079934 RepID=UPI0035248984
MTRSTETTAERETTEPSTTTGETSDDGVTGVVGTLLWNDTESRPRAPVRVLGVYVASFVGIFLLPGLLLTGISLPPSVNGAATNLVAAGVALAIVVVSAKYVDGRTLAAYGLARSPATVRDFLAGGLVGTLGAATTLSVSLVAGWATVAAVFSPGTGSTTSPFGLAMLGYVCQWLFVAFWEELIFRGLITTYTVEGLRDRLSDRRALVGGVVVAAVIFSAGHFPQSAAAFLHRAILGAVLGAAYVWTGSLALPVGLHFAVNFTQNNVFGQAAAADGASVLPMVIRPTFTGPEWAVGLYGVVNVAGGLLLLVAVAGYVVVVHESLGDRLPSTL